MEKFKKIFAHNSHRKNKLNYQRLVKIENTWMADQLPFQCFENLMEGIEKNLHSKNRDRFTHGLSIFRREVNDVLKVIYILKLL